MEVGESMILKIESPTSEDVGHPYHSSNLLNTYPMVASGLVDYRNVQCSPRQKSAAKKKGPCLKMVRVDLQGAQ